MVKTCPKFEIGNGPVKAIEKDTPLIFVGAMWADFLEWTRNHFLPNQLVNPEDLEIPYCVNTAEEAISILQKHHEKWRKEKEC